jgi:hypothetical protein
LLTRAKKIVYTAVTGGFDELRPPAVVDPDIDYIVYTEAASANVPPPWQARSIETVGRNPRVTSRWHKILAHRHLPDCRYSLWIDGNFEIVGSLSALIDGLAASAKLATQDHPWRNCIYDEAETVKRDRVDDPEFVDLQMQYYRRLGYPAGNGLIESSILFRAHDDTLVRSVMEAWWQQLDLFSQRDQLSANFVFWRHGLEYATVPSMRQPNPWLHYHGHRDTVRYLPDPEPDRGRRLDRATQYVREAEYPGPPVSGGAG